MVERPSNLLQLVAALALELCRAGSAGISLLETQNGHGVFRWEAVAGSFSIYRNKTMRRDASPCGITIDRNCSQLMSLPVRLFPDLKSYPFICEALLIPFYLDKNPVGTIWIVSHDLSRKFDREDERIVKVLANFASAGWQLWKARANAEKLSEELMVANESLQSQAILYKTEQHRMNQALEETKVHLLKKVMRLEDELDNVKKNLKKICE